MTILITKISNVAPIGTHRKIYTEDWCAPVGKKAAMATGLRGKSSHDHGKDGRDNNAFSQISLETSSIRA